MSKSFSIKLQAVDNLCKSENLSQRFAQSPLFAVIKCFLLKYLGLLLKTEFIPAKVLSQGGFEIRRNDDTIEC